MPIKMRRLNARLLVELFIVIAVLAVPATADEKCSACLPSSPPPPPALPPPSLPPPTPKKSPTKYHHPPPPPPGSFIYITGPPGNLYPIDENFSGAGRNSIVRLPVLVSCGLLGLLAFW